MSSLNMNRAGQAAEREAGRVSTNRDAVIPLLQSFWTAPSASRQSCSALQQSRPDPPESRTTRVVCTTSCTRSSDLRLFTKQDMNEGRKLHHCADVSMYRHYTEAHTIIFQFELLHSQQGCLIYRLSITTAMCTCAIVTSQDVCCMSRRQLSLKIQNCLVFAN